jgi:GDP-4-dehydro-6-deoxy-D-mannose reductase
VIRNLLERLIGRARVPVSIQVDPARYRPNDAPLLVGDPGRIRDRLGWSPRIAMDRTVDDLLEYWRNQG